MRDYDNKSTKKYSKSFQVMVARKKGDTLTLRYPFVLVDDKNTTTYTEAEWRKHLDDVPKDAIRCKEDMECHLDVITTEDGTNVYNLTRYYPALEGVEGNLALGTLCGYLLQERNMTAAQKVANAIKVGGKDVDAVIRNLQDKVREGKDDADITNVMVTWLVDPFEVKFSNRDGSKHYTQNVSALSVIATRKSEAE